MLRYLGKYVIVKDSCWKNTERYGLEMKKLLDMLTEEMQKAFEAAGLEPEVAEITWKAQNETKLTGEDAEKMQRLIDALEDLDDVQQVYTTAVFDEE